MSKQGSAAHASSVAATPQQLPRGKPKSKILQFRAMASAITSRIGWLARGGVTFGGKRDLYTVLGYKRELTTDDYRGRFDRNAIAARVVEALPKSTWRGGGELIEDENPENLTDFEDKFWHLAKRTKLWSMLLRGDILAGIGQFAIVVIGAPGKMHDRLPVGTGPDQIFYLKPWSQQEVEITTWDDNPESPRFGQALEYSVTRKSPTVNGRTTTNSTFRVHWTRVVHIADGLLDDQILGTPRLQRSWNLFDDLEKVTGGGSEAFWLRANQGIHVNLDSEMELEPEDEEDFDDEVDDYVHGQSRVIRTRGTEINSLGSDVANFAQPADAIITQIAGGEGIPKRILVGSERGDLASTQDRSNWNDRISDRRGEFAGPFVVRQLVDRLIEFKYLPTPKEYEVQWPQIQNLDEIERATVAKKWTSLNNDFPEGQLVVEQNEIRTLILGLQPKAAPKAESTPAPVPKAAVKSIKALVAKKRREAA